MNGWRVAQFGGLALALVMMVLMMVGTHSQTAFICWAGLVLVGIGIFAFCRKQDEAIQKRHRDEEFRARNSN